MDFGTFLKIKGSEIVTRGLFSKQMKLVTIKVLTFRSFRTKQRGFHFVIFNLNAYLDYGLVQDVWLDFKKISLHALFDACPLQQQYAQPILPKDISLELLIMNWQFNRSVSLLQISQNSSNFVLVLIPNHSNNTLVYPWASINQINLFCWYFDNHCVWMIIH